MRLAEPGQISPEEVARPELLEERATEKFCGRTYQLVRVCAGWEPAGSMMRATDGYFAVRFRDHGGSLHGQRFTNEHEARKLFDAWTTEEEGV